MWVLAYYTTKRSEDDYDIYTSITPIQFFKNEEDAKEAEMFMYNVHDLLDGASFGVFTQEEILSCMETN